MLELVLIIASCASGELLFRLPWMKVFDVMKQSVHDSKKIIFSQQISDHWKEKMLPVYAMRLLRSSLLLPLLLLTIFSPLVLATYGVIGSLDGVVGYLVELSSLAIVTVVCIGYFMIRKKLADG